MNSLLFYIISTGVCLSLFILTYLLFLKNNTRFNLCRFYLIAAILFSYIIPFITIDIGFSFISKKETITNTVKPIVADKIAVQELETIPAQIETSNWNIDYNQTASIIFISIALLLFVRFIFRFGSIILIQTSGNRFENEDGTNLIFTDRTDNAFSFLGSIFINPLKFTDEEKRLIIEHERQHIRNLHSIDLILVELLIVLQWFNPFAYIARRRLIEIHEFIADNGVIQKGADPYSYQNLLLSVVSSSCLPTVGNQLSALIIKKRIAMIGKPLTQTGRWINFLVLVPITLALIIGITAFSPAKPKSENQDDKKTELKEIAKKQGITDAIEELYFDLKSNEYQEQQTVELIGGNDYTFHFIPRTKEEGIHAYMNSNIKDVAQGGVLIFSGIRKHIVYVKKTSKFTLRIGNRSRISNVDLLAIICNNGKHNPKNDTIINRATINKPYDLSENSNLNSIEKKIDKDSIVYYDLKKRANINNEGVQIADYFINLEPNRLNFYTVTLKQGCEYILNLYTNNNDDKFNAVVSRGKLSGKLNKLLETKVSNSDKFSFTPTETGYYVFSLENISSNKTPALMVLSYNGKSKNISEWGKSEFPGIYEGLEKADKTYYQEVKKQIISKDEVFLVVEQMPVFGNGKEDDFRIWVASNMQYPKEAAEKGIQGRVFVQFVIEKDGSISNAKVLRGVDPLLDKEAIRVIQQSPKWKPGMQRGEPVRVQYTFPITFVLN